MKNHDDNVDENDEIDEIIDMPTATFQLCGVSTGPAGRAAAAWSDVIKNGRKSESVKVRPNSTCIACKLGEIYTILAFLSRFSITFINLYQK